MKLRKLLWLVPCMAVTLNLSAQNADIAAIPSSKGKTKSSKTKKGSKEKALKDAVLTSKSVMRTSSTDNTEIRNVSILNGQKDDFSPVFYENGLLFCSNSRKSTKEAKDNNKVPDDLNLKFAPFDTLGNVLKPAAFSHRTNSKTNEGPSCFSVKGDSMFLTRTMSKGGIVKINKDGDVTLKIYIKTKDKEGNFMGEELLPFESETSSYCHPTLSEDGRKLYFSSNMPGGFGGMDLWMTRKMKNDEWSQPINLGARVNTSKNELFPFISQKGMLYFSSNGRLDAKGGLDLYRIDIENRTARTFSMLDAFNSDGDDFGLMFLPQNEHKGYFSSNRAGGAGGDDIYEFEIK